MIQVKELRIGNWVQPNDSDYFDDINLNPIRFGFNDISNIMDTGADSKYDYIEITSKILERISVSKDNMFYFRSINNCDFRVKEKFDGYCFIMDGIVLKRKLKYLHELQNLFYSITNVEINDIVAYNFYLKILKEVTTHKSAMSFEEFLETIPKERGDWFQGIDYKLGDLPKNLF